MPKTPTRFSVRKVKCCYRNNMIAGNPITKTFEMFGIYDKDWQTDRFGGLPPFENVLKNKMQYKKFRGRLYRVEEAARKDAEEMNRLWDTCGRPAMIKFSRFGDVKVEQTEAKRPWV